MRSWSIGDEKNGIGPFRHAGVSFDGKVVRFGRRELALISKHGLFMYGPLVVSSRDYDGKPFTIAAFVVRPFFSPLARKVRLYVWGDRLVKVEVE